MMRIPVFALLVMLSAALMSCTDESITTAPTHNQPDIGLRASDQLAAETYSYHTVLARATHSADLAKKDDGGAFATPLFGLAVAPNNDILVADAGAGVATIHGATDIFLPGATGIGPIGRSSMWVSTGAGGDPTEDTGQGLYRVSKGRTALIANLYEFEQAVDPDGHVDSNPYDVASLGGQGVLVVDAGGNDLLRVDNRGNVHVLAVFPSDLVSTDNIKDVVGCPETGHEFCEGLPPMMLAESVPTSVAIGPDGYYYVGELRGFPAPSGVSSIWRVSPDASWAECGVSPDCQKVFDGGFTSIIDLAFGADGTLYVAELDELSWFAVELGGGEGGTVNACDVSTLACSVVDDQIPMLTAVTEDRDGTLWATKNALIPGLADVIAIPE